MVLYISGFITEICMNILKGKFIAPVPCAVENQKIEARPLCIMGHLILLSWIGADKMPWMQMKWIRSQMEDLSHDQTAQPQST